MALGYLLSDRASTAWFRDSASAEELDQSQAPLSRLIAQWLIFTRDATDFKQLLKRSKRLVVFTGAGASAGSGIPPYRGADGELLSKGQSDGVDSTYQDFLHNWAPEWKRIQQLQERVTQGGPNEVHRMIAEIGTRWSHLNVTVVNVDGLHDRDAIEMHGSAWRAVCDRCGVVWEMSTPVDLTDQAVAPCCHLCGGQRRPDLIYFGEEVPAAILRQVAAALDNCDLLMLVGCSG